MKNYRSLLLLFFISLSPIHHTKAANNKEISQEFLAAKQITKLLLTIMKTGNVIGYVEEPISQLQHALQTAQLMLIYLGKQAPFQHKDLIEKEEIEAVIAALFHDIAHLKKCTGENSPQMENYGTLHHETVGADFLEALGMSEVIGTLVRNHANAKRYLAATDTQYFEKLSPASQHTMAFQGGMMTPEECKSFEKHPHFELIIRLRHCDDGAKDPNAVTMPLEWFEPVLENYLYESFCENNELLKNAQTIIKNRQNTKKRERSGKFYNAETLFYSFIKAFEVASYFFSLSFFHQ